MVMISAFTTVDKTAHYSRKFAFTLSPTKYGYWKVMIEPFLITHNLMGYVDEYADALAVIGEPVKDKDLIMLTISGLLGSPSMTEPRQAQLSELAAQLSALGFQVSPIAPSGPQAFYGASPNNNMSNNNNNRGNRNNSRGNNNN
ncbi:hypothetical protein Tco_1497561 [Tanacetum coccineum]